MCGIAGIYAYHQKAREVDRRELRRIRDHMAARGPDGEGEWYSDDGRLGLGHRRLSIIDLSARGAQPMVDAGRDLAITFNGEIYNYRALRLDLEAKGHRFRSESDTEVLLHLYAEKGLAMLHDLRGMFAFGLWDGECRGLLLARDPYGIKPLYYADEGRTLRFASQVKALAAGGALSAERDPAGEAGFFLFGSVPEPHTILRDVHTLPAGSSLWVDRRGCGAPRSYFSIAEMWREAATHPTDTAAGAASEAIREALLDSVRHHQVADVPVGAFLSAGIDSGALVGLMTETAGSSGAPAANDGPLSGLGNDSGGPVHTITLAFEEFRGTPQDEAPLAEQVARHYGTNHATRRVGEPEFRADLPSILAAMDQPSIDGVNTWFVAKAAREQGLKVAVSGLGGDELFGGYPSFLDLPRWVRWLRVPSRIPGAGEAFRFAGEALARLCAAAGRPGSGAARRQGALCSISPKAAGLLKYGGTYPGAYLLRRGLFMPWELPEVMGPERVNVGLKQLDPLGLIGAALTPDPGTPFSRVAALEASLYMRNQLLRDADWAGMAHSLEIRVPLVDSVLLRRVAPLQLARLTGKAALAASPERPLPVAVRERRKTGFGVPFGSWVTQVEALNSWRGVPLLRRDHCHWARRLAYALGTV
jgi:asparagine synthase (glutamine-hydrolysing)